MLILSEEDLRKLLTMREVIDAIESGFKAVARGEAHIPERSRFDVPARTGIVLEMPAYVGSPESVETDALGTKIVSVFERNAVRGLPIVQAIYLLLDSETGEPLSLMEGRFITAIRTAATSAVATKFMATPGPKRLAVFGAGVQARSHIQAMIEVTDVGRVMISSRSAESARALANHVGSAHEIPCEVVSPESAAATANLICTCTTSPAPLFDGRVLTPGTHINAVGAFTPATRELDTETIRRARVIIDSESAAGQEAGEILLPRSEGAISEGHVKGTLAEVVSNKVAGRQSESEITVFKSCGLAIEDLVTARLAYARAIASGVGIQVKI